MAVSDTGTGMAPGMAQQATNVFVTTKPHGKGTGLGLRSYVRTWVTTV